MNKTCCRSKSELISDVLLWIPTVEYAGVRQPARIYLHQLCADTGCGLENQPGAMDDRDELRVRVGEICVLRRTWWWWRWWLFQCSLGFSILESILSSTWIAFVSFRFVLWHVNHCRLSNTKFIFILKQFYFKQFNLAIVHSLNVKNISTSGYSV